MLRRCARDALEWEVSRASVLPNLSRLFFAKDPELLVIGKDTGYAPKYDLEKACFEYIQWVKQNEY